MLTGRRKHRKNGFGTEEIMGMTRRREKRGSQGQALLFFFLFFFFPPRLCCSKRQADLRGSICVPQDRNLVCLRLCQGLTNKHNCWCCHLRLRAAPQKAQDHSGVCANRPGSSPNVARLTWYICFASQGPTSKDILSLVGPDFLENKITQTLEH